MALGDWCVRASGFPSPGADSAVEADSRRSMFVGDSIRGESVVIIRGLGCTSRGVIIDALSR